MSAPPALKICPQCHSQQPLNRQLCPQCGHKFRTKFAVPQSGSIPTIAHARKPSFWAALVSISTFGLLRMRKYRKQSIACASCGLRLPVGQTYCDACRVYTDPGAGSFSTRYQLAGAVLLAVLISSFCLIASFLLIERTVINVASGRPPTSPITGLADPVAKFFDWTLHDPSSLQVQSASEVEPYKDHPGDWTQSVHYRARNLMGALGVHDDTFIIEDGKVIGTVADEETRTSEERQKIRRKQIDDIYNKLYPHGFQ